MDAIDLPRNFGPRKKADELASIVARLRSKQEDDEGGGDTGDTGDDASISGRIMGCIEQLRALSEAAVATPARSPEREEYANQSAALFQEAMAAADEMESLSKVDCTDVAAALGLASGGSKPGTISNVRSYIAGIWYEHDANMMASIATPI
jgi:hypothetical protein